MYYCPPVALVCIQLLCLCWNSNRFTCLDKSKPVKQEVNCTVIHSLTRYYLAERNVSQDGRCQTQRRHHALCWFHFKANIMSRQAIELRIGSASLDTHSITPNLEELRFSIHPDFIFRFTLVNKRDRSLASGFVGMAEMFFRIGFKSRRKTDQIIPPGPIQFKFLGY